MREIEREKDNEEYSRKCVRALNEHSCMNVPIYYYPPLNELEALI